MQVEFVNYVGEDKVRYEFNSYEDYLICPYTILTLHSVFITLYEESPDSFIFLQSQVVHEDLIELDFYQYDCQSDNTYCFERTVFKKNLTFSLSPNPVYIISQKCCRDTTLVNIALENPDSLQGATHFLKLSPLAVSLQNSFPAVPIVDTPVLCVDKDFQLDLSTSDIDGDSLVYEFSPLYNGGGNTSTEFEDCDFVFSFPACPPPFSIAAFSPPYTFSAPLGDNVFLDSQTGQITGTVSDTGTYAFGLVVKEYRNGLYLGEIYSEHHVDFIHCAEEMTAAVNGETDDNNLFIIENCNSLSVTLENITVDTFFVEEWFYEFEIAGETEYFYDWSPTITFPAEGTYEGLLVINPGEICSDTAFLTVITAENFAVDFSVEGDLCTVNPLFFNNLSTGTIDSYTWNFGDGSSGQNRNGNHLYTSPGTYEVILTIENDIGCTETKAEITEYFPAPELIAIEPQTAQGCAPLRVEFANTTNFIDSTYTCFWDFGDGRFSEEKEPTHLYQTAGAYDVTLVITSPTGCEAERIFPNLIKAENTPLAAFSITNETINSLNSAVYPENQSQNAQSYSWYLDENLISRDFAPELTLPDTGSYELKLLAANEHGCLDSVSVRLYNAPFVSYYFPNAFSPNNDGINDLFKGKGAGFKEGISDYSLKIWNRWGELCFETNDPEIGWTGSTENSDRLAPTGTYTYHARFSFLESEIREFSGTLILLK